MISNTASLLTHPLPSNTQVCIANMMLIWYSTDTSQAGYLDSPERHDVNATSWLRSTCEVDLCDSRWFDLKVLLIIYLNTLFRYFPGFPGIYIIHFFTTHCCNTKQLSLSSLCGNEIKPDTIWTSNRKASYSSCCFTIEPYYDDILNDHFTLLWAIFHEFGELTFYPFLTPRPNTSAPSMRMQHTW